MGATIVLVWSLENKTRLTTVPIGLLRDKKNSFSGVMLAGAKGGSKLLYFGKNATDKDAMTGMKDSRWLGGDKMQYAHTALDGTKTTIHYVGQFKNGVLKAVDDFKFK